MTTIDVGESALVVEVAAVEPLVHDLRLKYDPVAEHSVPAHITVLFPFRSDIDDHALEQLTAIAAATPVFDVTFERLDEFPGQVIWLRPAPDEPFRDLTRRLAAGFPDCPPYRGRFDDPQPHLTVAHVEGAALDSELGRELRESIEPRLPVTTTLRRLSLIISDGERWHRGHTFSFG